MTTSESGAGVPSIEIFCVKCKVKTATANIERVTMKNGRAAASGECVKCGTRKFRIGELPKAATP